MKNLKKVIALVAVFAMMISTVAFAQTFSDVANDHDYYEAIEMLSKLSILTGDDEDGNGVMDFRPADTITRAEVAAIVSRIQGINSVAQAPTSFVDVPSSHWASGYVAQAAGQGIVNGYGDGNFGPENPVLYEEAVKMLMETLGYAPYAAEAGGYPTGYLTAATRSGVLDGVIGGSVGKEASRGQIAQMVYNAVDTPLMVRSSFGTNAEYVIMDNADKDGFETLFTRDLGVKKFSGVITANRYSSGLKNPVTNLDMSEDEVIAITPDENSDYVNYDVEDVEDATLYAGESGAGEYIGKHVNILIRESGNDYEVVSAAESNKNRTKTITLDLLDEYVYGETSMKYRETANGSSDTLNNIYEDAYVIYNGVALSDPSYIDTILTDKDVLSGQITFIDNGSKDKDNKSMGYSVIDIDVAVSAVVDEISDTNVLLKEQVVTADDKSFGGFDFDEEDTSTSIVLTKNGKSIEYTELKEWDVLSILANDSNEYYVAEVIDGGKIEGTISSSKKSNTSYDGRQYTIDNVGYDVAKNAYLSGRLEPGASGVFYVDSYGKIVAYDKNGTVNKASDKYAYVLAAKTEEDAWENSSLRVQILDKSGNVYDAYLADTVKFDNIAKGSDVADAIGGLVNDDFQDGYASESKKIADVADADALADALVNQVITYTASSTGEVRGITFAANYNDNLNSLTLASDGPASYDRSDASIRVGGDAYDLNEDTIVFFISGGTDDEGSIPVWIEGQGVVGTASKSASKVSNINSLSDDYEYAQVYDSDGDTAKLLVIYNSTGGVSSSTNIALIESVGTGILDGDTVKTVEYWLGGKKMSSAVNPDAEGASKLPEEGEGKGSIYKFNVSEDGSIINEVRPIATYDRNRKPGKAGVPTFNVSAITSNERVYFAPLTDSVSNNRFKLAKSDIDGDKGYADEDTKNPIAFDADTVYDFGNHVSVRVEDANVYVFDANKRSNQIETGIAADAKYNKNLVENIDNPVTQKVDGSKEELVPAGEVAYGLMDFVAAFEYDRDIIDIVIYKAYDFGRFSR